MKKRSKIALLVLGGVAGTLALNCLPMVSLKTPGMERFSAHGIELFAEPQDREEALQLARRIDSQSRAIVEALEIESSNDFGVIVYPGRKALHRKTIGLAGMVLLPDWFIGDNTREYVLITSPAVPGPSHSRESIEQAAVHEYVHLLTDRRNKALGYWLKEGFALYLAEQRPDSAALRQHRDITWEEFSRPSALQFAEVGGYSLAYNMMEHLVERYGWDRVVMLTAPGENWESVLGVSKRTVFEEWKRGLEKV